MCKLYAPILGPQFYQSLHWRQRSTSNRNPASDIYGGELHQALSGSDGPLMEGRAISVTLNTDGVVCFHSTNQSFWPVLLMINELPFSER